MTGQRPLLVVADDDQSIVDVVERFARRAGFEVVACVRGRQAIAQLQMRRADLVMLDLHMAEVNGLDVLRAIRETDPHCQAVLMTGFPSLDTAVEAIKLGAMDYLAKPLDFGRLEQVLTAVAEEIERRRSVLSMEGDLARRLAFCGMVGRGPLMQELFAAIRRLAPHVHTALITGEAGTGKDLVARALHRTGPRRERRLVTVDCAAFVEPLLERELFGQVRGAFPGADGHAPGLFELADGGTIFLDEIGTLPPNLQARLLRVLEVGEIQRVGSLDARRVNAHVIATTNRDLGTEVAAGRFRSDLYRRLTVVDVRVPALRERREDIPYLTAAFVREWSERLQKPPRGLTPGAERLLATANWDGNVRELRSVIERVCSLAEGDFITEREVAATLPAVPVPPEAAGGHSAAVAGTTRSADADLLVNVERDHIRRALVRAGGNKKAAAKMLGLSRRALYRRLERLDLATTIARRRESAFIEA